jgi:hypothetical protein
MKEPNGVIEAGDKTWNAGATKYFRYRDKIANFEGYEVKENGKTKIVSVDEFIRLEIDTRAKIIRNAQAVQSECDVILKLIGKMLEQRAGADGYFNALVNIGMDAVSGNEPPPNKNALNARAAAGAVISATDRSKVDWKKVKMLVTKAQKAHQKAVKEWHDFNSKNMKNAEWGAFGANIVSEGAFGVLEVLATGYLITTRGMDPKRAQVVAAVGVDGLKVSAGEVGEYVANDKFDPAKSAMKVSSSMMITGVAAALGTKLSGSALTKVLGKLEKLLAREFSTGLQKGTYKIAQAILSGPKGENMIKSAIAEIGNLGKDAAAGKKIDEKRVIDALVASLFGTLVGSSSVKGLKKFDNTWQNRSVRVAQQEFGPILNKKLTLKLVASNPKGTVSELMKKEGNEIIGDAVKKMADLTLKTGYSGVINHITGKEEKVDDFEKLAIKAIKKDAALISKLEAAALKEAEAKLKKLESAK